MVTENTYFLQGYLGSQIIRGLDLGFFKLLLASAQMLNVAGCKGATCRVCLLYFAALPMCNTARIQLAP